MAWKIQSIVCRKNARLSEQAETIKCYTSFALPNLKVKLRQIRKYIYAKLGNNAYLCGENNFHIEYKTLFIKNL